MASEYELDEELQVLQRRWELITEVPKPPRTVFNVIDYSLGNRRKAEEYVNRLLRYFLDPQETHGMNTEFLQAFLDGLPSSDIDEWPFQEDTLDLSGVDLDDQVQITITEAVDDGSESSSPGYVDLVIKKPNEWFLLIELKFSAEENNLGGSGHSQTEFYYAADQIDGEAKEEFESGQYYLYLHQTGSDEAREETFVNWTWSRFVNDVLAPFLTDNTPRFPHRTVVQLRELRDDIQEITNMADQQSYDAKKIELYLDHYESINDVSETFDDHWETFTEQWPLQLIDALSGEHVLSRERFEDPSYLTVDLELEAGESSRWVFLTRSADWGMLFKHGWWRRTDTLEPIPHRPDDRNDARIGFHHRLDGDLNEVLRNQKLHFYFRNMGANDQQFKNAIKQNFDANETAITNALPDAARVTGYKRNMIQATYDIPIEDREDLFEAYIVALKQAFTDHVIENPELVSLLTEIYRDSLSVYDQQ